QRGGAAAAETVEHQHRGAGALQSRGGLEGGAGAGRAIADDDHVCLQVPVARHRRPPSSAEGKTVTCSSMDEVDVVVAGSGAAGMTAALTAAHLGLSALVIEKAGSFGGSTARSGGGIWAPGNAVLRAAGVADTPEQARAYLAHVAEGVPAARREA